MFCPSIFNWNNWNWNARSFLNQFSYQALKRFIRFATEFLQFLLLFHFFFVPLQSVIIYKV